jgi:hypothetical protein
LLMAKDATSARKELQMKRSQRIRVVVWVITAVVPLNQFELCLFGQNSVGSVEQPASAVQLTTPIEATPVPRPHFQAASIQPPAYPQDVRLPTSPQSPPQSSAPIPTAKKGNGLKWALIAAVGAGFVATAFMARGGRTSPAFTTTTAPTPLAPSLPSRPPGANPPGGCAGCWDY